MYKVASDKRQSGLHRGRLSDWLNGNEFQNAEQRLRQLQEGAMIIERRLLALPQGEERRNLGIQKLAMQKEIHQFRKAMNLVRQARDDWPQVFVSMAKDIMSKSEFELISRAANRECDRRQQELNDTSSPSHTADLPLPSTESPK